MTALQKTATLEQEIPKILLPFPSETGLFLKKSS